MIYKYLLYFTANKTMVLQNSQYMDNMVLLHYAIIFFSDFVAEKNKIENTN